MVGQSAPALFPPATLTPAQARTLLPATPYYLPGDPTLHYAAKRVVPLFTPPTVHAAAPPAASPLVTVTAPRLPPVKAAAPLASSSSSGVSLPSVIGGAIAGTVLSLVLPFNPIFPGLILGALLIQQERSDTTDAGMGVAGAMTLIGAARFI